MSECSVSAFAGVKGNTVGLENCLSAEEAYLLDRKASIENESFVGLR